MGHQKRPLEVPPNSPLSSTARVRLRVLGTWLLWPRSSLYRLRAPASRRRPRFASTATTTPASKHASARIANPRRAQFCLPPRSRATTPVAPVCYTGAHCAEKQRRQRDRTLLPRGAIHECDWQKRFSFPPLHAAFAPLHSTQFRPPAVSDARRKAMGLARAVALRRTETGDGCF